MVNLIFLEKKIVIEPMFWDSCAIFANNELLVYSVCVYLTKYYFYCQLLCDDKSKLYIHVLVDTFLDYLQFIHDFC